jgi:hypothetical protein
MLTMMPMSSDARGNEDDGGTQFYTDINGRINALELWLHGISAATNVHAMLTLRGQAPVGLPDTAVLLERIHSFGGTVILSGLLATPDTPGLLDIAYTLNGGTSWVLRRAGNLLSDAFLGLDGVMYQAERPQITSIGLSGLNTFRLNVDYRHWSVNHPLSNLKVYGVVRPVGSPRPVGELPSDAFEITRRAAQTSHMGSHEGTFTWPAADGDYVIYVSPSGGAFWDANPPFNSYGEMLLRVRGGKPYSVAGSTSGYGWRVDNPYAEVHVGLNGTKDGLDVSIRGPAYLTDISPYYASLVDEFTGDTISSGRAPLWWRDDNIVSASAWGANYNKAFALPKDNDGDLVPGFYKVYVRLEGTTYEGFNAVWVQRDDDDEITVEIIDMFNGIGGRPMTGIVINPNGYTDEYINEQFESGNLRIPRISLSEERLWFNLGMPASFPGAGPPDEFSLDGGNRWTRFTGQCLRRILNSAKAPLNIHVRNETGVYIFPTIHPRPERPRLTANYQALYLLDEPPVPSLEQMPNQTFWALTASNCDIVVNEGFEISTRSYNMPFGTGANYMGRYSLGAFHVPQRGIAVLPLRVQGVKEFDDFGVTGIFTFRLSQVQNDYFVRAYAKENADGSFTAASSEVRLRARGLERPRSIRPNYRRGSLRAPRGMMYRRDGGEINRSDGRTTRDIGSDSRLTYRRLPTRRSPGSVQIDHTLALPGEFDLGNTSITNGRLSAAKSLEFSYDGGVKWGNFKRPSGPQGDSIILVRTKASGRVNSRMSFDGADSVSARVNDSGGTFRASSKAYLFTYVWGDITAANGRTTAGILDFAVEPPE